MSDITVALYEEFMPAYSKLPLGLQTKTNNFIKKFKQNPKTLGIHLEKVFNPYDDKIYSGRIDKTYRIIIAIQEKSNTYIFLYVDHHDEAYKWANTKKIEINKQTGVLQLYDFVQIKIEETPVTCKLFDKYTDEQLIALGVPDVQLQFVRSIVDESNFYNEKDKFSNDVYDYLSFLVSGNDYSEVLAIVNEFKEEKITESFAEALKTKATRGFAVIDGQQELDKMFDAPLDQWRIFLHPSQKKLVDNDFSGPARVSGEAGTGKTVVAMHRAKYLLSQGRKVLFTTFTTNLVGDIETNIMKILTLTEAKNLDIKGIDSVVISYLNSRGKRFRIIYDEDVLLRYWNNAIQNANIDLNFDASFYMEEWRQIASVLDSLSIEKYISVPRVGRGIRLDRSQRLKVWHVFEEYMSLLRDDDYRDIDFATYEARELLKTQPENPYDSIIVDECQDISANAFKFLRMYAGEEHENDLFIVGDSHQRIYKNKAILSKCEINIKGRSSILKINYRTTEETRKYAFSFLNGINFDDIDTEYTNKTKCQSLTHGEKPIVKNFRDFNEQLLFVAEEISKILESGVPLENICIVARTHKQIELAFDELNKKGIVCYEINSNKKDNSSEQGVRFSTMHRIKGLEFRYVFVISVNRDIIPALTSHVDSNDNNDNLLIERCLLYVSLTRAQIKAYVLSFGEPSSLLN